VGRAVWPKQRVVLRRTRPCVFPKTSGTVPGPRPSHAAVPEKIFVLYNYTDAEREQAQHMFLDAGLLDVVVTPHLLTGHHKLELRDDDAARRLRIAARLHGLREPHIQRILHPTEKELRAAKLLYMHVWIHNAPNGHPREGTSYDDSDACPECGDGLRQTSPLRLKNKEIPKAGALLGGIRDQVLVQESLACEMMSVGLSGVTLEPVLDAAGQPIPWRQLVVERSMPPMTLATRGVVRGRGSAEGPCSRCGCDGYFDSGADPFVPAYDAAVLDELPDFALTAERFGTGAWGSAVHGQRHLASRRIIVRPSVYAFFRERKVRGLRFTPVAVTQTD
jgi:hypothetical protein